MRMPIPFGMKKQVLSNPMNRLGYFAAFIMTVSFTGVLAQRFNCYPLMDRVFSKAAEPPVFKGSLTRYLDSVLHKQLATFTGTVQFNIIIDSAGKACCSYIPDSGSFLSSKELKAAIDHMPAWKPARQNGRTVNFYAVYLLSHSNGNLQLKETH